MVRADAHVALCAMRSGGEPRYASQPMWVSSIIQPVRVTKEAIVDVITAAAPYSPSPYLSPRAVSTVNVGRAVVMIAAALTSSLSAGSPAASAATSTPRPTAA